MYHHIAVDSKTRSSNKIVIDRDNPLPPKANVITPTSDPVAWLLLSHSLKQKSKFDIVGKTLKEAKKQLKKQKTKDLRTLFYRYETKEIGTKKPTELGPFIKAFSDLRFVRTTEPIEWNKIDWNQHVEPTTDHVSNGGQQFFSLGGDHLNASVYVDESNAPSVASTNFMAKVNPIGEQAKRVVLKAKQGKLIKAFYDRANQEFRKIIHLNTTTQAFEEMSKDVVIKDYILPVLEYMNRGIAEYQEVLDNLSGMKGSLGGSPTVAQVYKELQIQIKRGHFDVEHRHKVQPTEQARINQATVLYKFDGFNTDPLTLQDLTDGQDLYAKSTYEEQDTYHKITKEGVNQFTIEEIQATEVPRDGSLIELEEKSYLPESPVTRTHLHTMVSPEQMRILEGYFVGASETETEVPVNLLVAGGMVDATPLVNQLKQKGWRFENNAEAKLNAIMQAVKPPPSICIR